MTLEIESVDPLSVFRRAGSKSRRYWERPDDGLAVTAIGTAWQSETLPAAVQLEHLNDGLVAVGSDVPPLLLGGIPFDPRAVNEFPFAVPSIMVRRLGEVSHLTVSTVIDGDEKLNGLETQIERAEMLLAGTAYSTPRAQTVRSVRVIPTADGWNRLVERALGAIGEGSLSKVVVARQQEISFAEAPHPVPIIENLRQEYPNTSVFALEQNGCCFLGASPERLVKVQGGRFQADCLAGSVARGANVPDDETRAADLLTDRKNQREHSAVVESVVETLAPLSINLKVDGNASIRTIRNVHHLFTNVEGVLKSAEFGVLDVAAVLNPTAAMAGAPKAVALDFIRANEGFDRGLYSGAVGWSDLDGNGDLAVGIRSALLAGESARLYAGCGIVEGSDPAAEWAETEVKLLPMRSALGLI